MLSFRGVLGVSFVVVDTDMESKGRSRFTELYGLLPYPKEMSIPPNALKYPKITRLPSNFPYSRSCSTWKWLYKWQLITLPATLHAFRSFVFFFETFWTSWDDRAGIRIEKHIMWFVPKDRLLTILRRKEAELRTRGKLIQSPWSCHIDPNRVCVCVTWLQCFLEFHLMTEITPTVIYITCNCQAKLEWCAICVCHIWLLSLEMLKESQTVRCNHGNNNHLDHVYILMTIYGITLVLVGWHNYMITKSHHHFGFLTRSL